MPDSTLQVLSTFKLARRGEPVHLLSYQPDAPLDYHASLQFKSILRVLELPAPDRYDLSANMEAAVPAVAAMLQASTPPDTLRNVPVEQFAKNIVSWTLMSVRSLTALMRVDQELYRERPELREGQQIALEQQQDQNRALLAFDAAGLAIPTSLFAPQAAFALFTDRLLGGGASAVPYLAIGVLSAGEELLHLWDTIPSGPEHDRTLIDTWAQRLGVRSWYHWSPQKG